MSGVGPLVDTLLATRLVQRIDLVPLKSAVQIAGPGALADAESGGNDVRLPSRAALQQSGPSLTGQGDNPPPSAPGLPVTLSVAARAVSEVLQLSGSVDEAMIRGSEPLWSGPQPPSTLAANLSHIVASSGLFYESHLRQFAAGTRTLAQLELEPQAGLDSTPSRHQELAAAMIHPDAVPLVRQQLELLAMPTIRWAGEAWPGTPLSISIHEETRQQASRVDRDGDGDSKNNGNGNGNGNQTIAPTWTTRLVMQLPRLGDVEVCVGMTGDLLTLQIAAAETATTALLGQGSDALSKRFKVLGLALGSLQVSQQPGQRMSPERGDAA